MGAKKAESLRCVSGNNNVVRFFYTVLLDNCWMPPNFSGQKKRFLIVKHPLAIDKYLMDFDLKDKKFWDTATYNELDILAPVPSDPAKRDPMKPEKIRAARQKIKEAAKEFFWSDDWHEAQNKYIEWAQIYCGKTAGRKIIGKNLEGDD